MSFQHKDDFLGLFANHRVAANLLMIMMILSGVWGLTKLNTQFFPSFELDYVVVNVSWTGASAEDVESSITTPIELELRSLDGLRELTSTSTEGRSSVVLEYEEGTDMGIALDKVKEQIDLIRNLPTTAETPEVSKIVRYEPVARLLVTTQSEPRDLRTIVHQIERELLDRGIAKIAISGLPEEEIAIQVASGELRELGLSLSDVADRIAERSRDIPAGTIGRDDISRQLRALQQQRREIEFEEIPLFSDERGRLLKLGDIAVTERRARARQTQLTFRGLPAVELQLQRAEGKDSLKAARILEQWLEENQDQLPSGIALHVFDESWQLIKQRIELLLRNGLTGLALVVAILFVFMNARVAWWVAVGIPVSFMATLGILYWVGGSINMISLFAMIMTLGIIVDDAIVVGENALSEHEGGHSPLASAEGGARRMLAPVLSSSLTTVAAFFPLMLVSGIIGNILFDIPLVVICVILASLIESFLVLPGHLRHSFENLSNRPTGRTRRYLEGAFACFREGFFRPLVRWATHNPATVLCGAITALVLTVGLFVGGRLAFNFFPSAEGTIIHANVAFVAGTPPAQVARFLDTLEEALYETEKRFVAKIVDTSVTRLGSAKSADEQSSLSGDQYGSITVQLVEPDLRSVRNTQFITAWRDRVTLVPGIENFSIFERKPGPPGRDIEVRLTGADPQTLKSAALTLGEALNTMAGVIGVEDDLPYGAEQLIYSLTPLGQALGLTVESVGNQLRAAYDGRIAQIFQDGEDEIEVRVVLPDEERHRLSSLDTFALALPGGKSVPLLSVVEISTQRGFQSLKKTDGRLSVRVSADLDPAITNANLVKDILRERTLATLTERFGVDYDFEGRDADQDETLTDMRRGGLLALAIIYLVLAWVFASYGWPLVVMSVIPFGLVGALCGHWIMGLDITILSLFGLFGLSGIVVNDSIILVTFFKQLREQGVEPLRAIVDASCLRLRAVLLTSLTTIGGLMPLIFETSLQAQFLIPMAVSICFGLAFSTALVLVLIPSLLVIHEYLAGRIPTSPPDPPVTAATS